MTWPGTLRQRITSSPFELTWLTFTTPLTNRKSFCFGSPSRKIFSLEENTRGTEADKMLWRTASERPSKSSGVLVLELSSLVSGIINLRTMFFAYGESEVQTKSIVRPFRHTSNAMAQGRCRMGLPGDPVHKVHKRLEGMLGSIEILRYDKQQRGM